MRPSKKQQRKIKISIDRKQDRSSTDYTSKTVSFVRILVSCFLCLALKACSTPQDIAYQRGVKYQSKGALREAVAEFDKAMKRSPGTPVSLRAARESTKIFLYDLKNYDRSINTLRYIILYSKDPLERWKAQDQIAQIYFDNLAWYDKALTEYSKLLSSQLSSEDQIRVRMTIARIYYYLGQFSQSWSESNEIQMTHALTKDQTFDLQLLQANILLAQKKFQEAAQSFENLLIFDSERARKENVGLNLALCYEELGSFKETIRTLEAMLPFYEPKEYIELRVRRVKERFDNAPKKRLKK